jgi:TonB family protein
MGKHPMKKSLLDVSGGLLICALLVSGCRDQPVSGSQIKAVIGHDTITSAVLSRFLDRAGSDSSETMRMAVLIKLAKESESAADTAGIMSDADDVSERISLLSERSFNKEIVRLFLLAGKTLANRVKTVEDAQSAARHIDSLFAMVVVTGSKPSLPDIAGKLKTASFNSSRAAIAGVLIASFDIEPAISHIIADYSLNPNLASSKEIDAATLVKGLAAKRRARKSGAPVSTEVTEKPAVAVNPELAIQYRSPQSILDTINQHIPYIQAIYKRELKLHQSLSGKVIVSFIVDTAGSVLSAGIVESDISSEVFISDLLAYLKRIKFLPVPGNAGNMTFRFPFEFMSNG